MTDNTGIMVELNPVGVEARYANASEENRKKFAADMAAVSFNRTESKNPSKRYNEFFHEAVGNSNIFPECECGHRFTGEMGYELKDDCVEFSFECPKCKKENKRVIPSEIPSSGWFEFYWLSTYPGDIFVRKGPSRPLENIPVVFNIEKRGNDFVWINEEGKEFFVCSLLPYSNLCRFAYMEPDKDGKLKVYTNLRNLVQLGVPYEDIPYNKDVPSFVAFRVKAPYFTFAQIRTHGQLTQIAQSDRWSKEKEYWLPDDIEEKFRAPRDKILDYLLSIPPSEAQEELKIKGYPLEIYQRWPNFMKIKHWTMSGYINDPNSVIHFLLQRKAFPELISDKTQNVTAKVSSAMRKLLEEYMRKNIVQIGAEKG